MDKYRVGQVYVVAKNFSLSKEANLVINDTHHFEGEHFEITEYDNISPLLKKRLMIISSHTISGCV